MGGPTRSEQVVESRCHALLRDEVGIEHGLEEIVRRRLGARHGSDHAPGQGCQGALEPTPRRGHLPHVARDLGSLVGAVQFEQRSGQLIAVSSAVLPGAGVIGRPQQLVRFGWSPLGEL